MTKEELWNELLEHNEEDFICEICENIPTYMIAISGLVQEVNIKQVWLCKQCFFKGEDNDKNNGRGENNDVRRNY